MKKKISIKPEAGFSQGLIVLPTVVLSGGIWLTWLVFYCGISKK